MKTKKVTSLSFRRAFGQSFIEWRERSGLTQKELGSTLGVSQVGIAQFEGGLNLMSVYNMAIAARRLDIGIGELAELLYGEATRQMQPEEFEDPE